LQESQESIMVKPMMAGLMCVGLITLGVAITRGENADEVKPNPDLGGGISVVQTGVPSPIVVGKDIDILVDANRVQDVAGQFVVDVTGVGDQFLFADAPEAILKVAAGDDKVVNFAWRGPVNDEHARQALEKVIAGLKQEAAELAKAGKKEELERKAQSITALESLLRGEAGGVRFFDRRIEGPARIVRKVDDVRLEKLKAEMAELGAKMAASSGESGEAREQKLRALGELMGARKAEIEQLVQRKIKERPDAIESGKGPEVSADVVKKLAEKRVTFIKKEQDQRQTVKRELERKLSALQRGAEALKGAGLDDQSRKLLDEADQLKREAEAKNREAETAQKRFEEEFERAMRAANEANVVAQKAAADAAGATAARFRNEKLQILKTGPGGNPQELQQALLELREQVQELRKEVAQLRGVLEKK